MKESQKKKTDRPKTVPDFRYINRHISIRDIARALELRFGSNGLVHCWHPERHQQGDRTASVAIRGTNNTVKCFGCGCGVGPLGPVNLVRDVLGIENPREAAAWIAERFPVPDLPPGKHLVDPPRYRFRYGFETETALLVHSGLWARLSNPARLLVPVFLALSDPDDNSGTRRAQASYRALSRYSGIASPNCIRKGITELEDIGWLICEGSKQESKSSPVRTTATYIIIPKSDEVIELANETVDQFRKDIELERQVREQVRKKRRITTTRD